MTVVSSSLDGVINSFLEEESHAKLFDVRSSARVLNFFESHLESIPQASYLTSYVWQIQKMRRLGHQSLRQRQKLMLARRLKALRKLRPSRILSSR
jgi:hypothetical protein